MFEAVTSPSQPPFGDKRFSLLDWLFVLAAAVFIYLMVFKLPSTPIVSESDSLIFFYEAGRLLSGDVMYRDFFEFTFPGTQILYALLLSLIGQKYWILPAVMIAIGVANSVILLRISKKLILGPFRFLPPMLFIFFGFRWLGLDGSHRMFSPIFILLTVLILLSGQKVRHFALAGVSCAFASFFTQQRGIATIGAILIFLVLEGSIGAIEWKRVIRSGAALGTCFVITISLLCSYFVFAAGWDNFSYATFIYPALYYTAGDSNSYSLFFTELGRTIKINGVSEALTGIVTISITTVLPAICPLVFVIFLVRGRSSWHTWHDRILLSLIGIILVLATIGPTPGRLFQICSVSLILFGWLLSTSTWLRKYDRALTAGLAAILLIIASIQVYRTQVFWKYEVLQTPTGQLAFYTGPAADKYSWLLRNTSEGDYIFETQTAFVYFPLQLKNPTRIGQIWPSEYTRPEQVQDVIAGLNQHKPRVILWESDYSKPPEEREAGDHIAPLYEYLKKEYRPTGASWITPGNHAFREAWIIQGDSPK